MLLASCVVAVSSRVRAERCSGVRVVQQLLHSLASAPLAFNNKMYLHRKVCQPIRSLIRGFSAVGWMRFLKIVSA